METDNTNPNPEMGIGNVRPEQNFGIGKTLYNSAMDKLIEANSIKASDKTELYSRLNEESNSIFRQSIPYLENAVKYYDSLKEPEKKANSIKLYQSLNALSTVYIRLGMYEELKPIKTRIDEYL